MIGTHSVKAFDASVKQDGICADIIAPHSGNIISSQTVKVRRKYFAMPRNAANFKQFLDDARNTEAWRAILNPRLCPLIA